MKFEKDEVYSIKLVTGDELVAKVLDSDDHQITVASPLTVIPGPQGIQLIPSLFTAELDSRITINISTCSMVSVTRDQVKDSYTEAVTGIKPVRNKILMG